MERRLNGGNVTAEIDVKQSARESLSLSWSCWDYKITQSSWGWAEVLQRDASFTSFREQKEHKPDNRQM